MRRQRGLVLEARRKEGVTCPGKGEMGNKGTEGRQGMGRRGRLVVEGGRKKGAGCLG